MKMSEKCCNNNSDNPLTSRRTDGGKNCSHVMFGLQLPINNNEEGG